MKLDRQQGLWKLLVQQFQESNAYVSQHLGEWAYLMDLWRGVKRDKGEYGEVTEDSIYRNAFYSDNNIAPMDVTGDEADVMTVREVMKHVETCMSRFDKMYLSVPTPFNLNLPKVFHGAPPNPQELARRKTILEGHGEYLAYDWRAQGNAEEALESLRDWAMLGIGWSYHRLSDDGLHAIWERPFPWNVLPDPLNKTAGKMRYAIVKRWEGVARACEMFPELAGEIKDWASRSRTKLLVTDGMDSFTEEKRKEILILEYNGFYDPKMLKKALIDDELQDIGNPVPYTFYMLGDEYGPSDICLDHFENPLGDIPLQEYVVLRDPASRGPIGYGIAHGMADVAVYLTTLVNRMLLAFEWATQPGGFINAEDAKSLEKVLGTTLAPGEFRAIELPMGQKLTDAVSFLPKPDFTGQHMNVVEWLRKEPSRLDGITDYNSNLPIKTGSDTLGELQGLAAEGNELMRFKAQRLDVRFQRAYHIHVKLSAWAMKVAMKAQPEGSGIFYRDSQDQIIQVDPTVFDQDYEVEIHSGSTALGGEQEANKKMYWAAILQKAGVPFGAAALARSAIQDQGGDPDDYGIPSEEDLKAQAAKQMLEQAVQMQQQGGPPGMPGQVPVPPPPGPGAQPMGMPPGMPPGMPEGMVQ